jgi:hypothetical protein
MSCPYAPLTPAQEAELTELLAQTGRLTRERILKGLRGASVEEADRAIRKLRGEPAAPVVLVVAAPADRATTRALIAEQREILDAHFATRAMQPVGLSQPSHFAGMNGKPYGTLR